MEIITVEDALVAVYVFAAIAAIEAGIIGGLAMRVDLLRKLFRLIASVANNYAHNTTKKKSIPPNQIQE